MGTTRHVNVLSWRFVSHVQYPITYLGRLLVKQIRIHGSSLLWTCGSRCIDTVGCLHLTVSFPLGFDIGWSNGLSYGSCTMHSLHTRRLMSPNAIFVQRSAKRWGCLLSYSQAEPGRELTQPRKHLLAEPCTIAVCVRKRSSSAEVII